MREKADTRRDDWSGEGSHLAGLQAPGTMVEVWGLPASPLASWRWPPPGRWSGAEPWSEAVGGAGPTRAASAATALKRWSG
jgi:hypothetical protein